MWEVALITTIFLWTGGSLIFTSILGWRMSRFRR
jgi:hypothetical protein